MVTVPPEWADGLKALEKSVAGLGLLYNHRLAAVVVCYDDEFESYGRTTSANKIFVSRKSLGVAHKACILAHELTHCLDLSVAGESWESYARSSLAYTEINAHFNQGKVLREIREYYPKDIDEILKGSSVWSASLGWHTRIDVIRYLSRSHAYGSHMSGFEIRDSDKKVSSEVYESSETNRVINWPFVLVS